SPVVTNLNDVVESILKMLTRLIGEDICLDWIPGKELHNVKIDPGQVDQILANLCVNSRDAISDVGRITIETANISIDKEYCEQNAGYKPGEYILLAVSDDGSGMDKATLEHIFEPFFTTKEKGQGTGLGLATTYGIVKQNNGFINVYSEPGEGTTFRIYFPCSYDKNTIKRTDQSDSIQRGHGQKVLLVEDESAIRKIGVKMLEELGFVAVPASDPDEAIEIIKEHKESINILLTDVVLPGMNGKRLYDELEKFNPELKVIYMSGYTANVIAHHGILQEGIVFLQKPFSMKELSLKISQLFNTRKN
ncbi:MAG: ATP-binding protein, partial [Candidatus Cloacimonetes bacterium]|nr:ATP-binding protein [Candidatus Cloacimonadota bacterium]